MVKRIWLLALVVLVVPTLGRAQLASSQAPSAALTPSAEAFAATPYMDQPELSPDGLFYATKNSQGGKAVLLIRSLEQPGAPQVSLPDGEQDGELAWWRWVTNDWLLVATSDVRKVKGEDTRFSSVLAINRTTGVINRIAANIDAENKADVIHISRDGRPRILLGVQRSTKPGPNSWTEVFDVDVSTGALTSIIKPRANFTRYVADPTGTVRMGVAYDDAKQLAQLYYRLNASMPFEEIDRAEYGKSETLMVPDLFMAEPGKALTISSTDGYAALYEFDFNTMIRGKKVFGLDGYDINNFAMTPKADGAVGVMVTEKRARIYWIDPSIAASQREIDAKFGEGNALVLSWSRQFSRFIVRVGGPDQAGAFYLFDTKAKDRFRLLGLADETLKMNTYGPVSTIKYTARDGVPIEAVLTLPKGKVAKGLPLIVLPHGGPEARDSEGWDWWVQFLASRGYAVIQPNYRGSTGYGRRLLNLGTGQWGLKMQDDLLDAVDHLAKLGIADPKRVCIVGASYGGYAAMRGAQRDGSRYRCAISYAGVSDLRGMIKYDGKFLNGATARSGWEASAPDIDAISPLRGPAGFSTPILIMHGARDMRVPVKQSREMAARLKAAHKPVRYVEQPLGDHHLSRPADRLEFLREMETFLRQYNPAN
jgi:dipeptidyl aminopeptidase/acylaminoacyl peptidase